MIESLDGPVGAPLFRIGPPPVFPLFDVHANVMPGGERSGFYAVQPPEAVTRSGVDAANLAPAAGRPYGESSPAILRWASEAGAQWRAMLRLSGRRVPSPLRSRFRFRRAVSLARETQTPDLSDLSGYAAVKLMPHADGLPDPGVLSAVGEAGTPLLIHAGANCPIAFLRKHVLPHTKSPVILAHMGAWPCAMEELIAAVELARVDERVFLETSGVWIGNFVTYAAERVPEKILFGSNAPMCEPAVQWGHVAASVSDDEVLEGIAYRNAERLFGARCPAATGRPS